MIRVLIVEDNRVSARWLQAAIEQSALEISGSNFEFQFHVAASTEEACTLLGMTPQDVVTLDLSLRATEGEDTFKSIHDYFPEVPIIVVTASNGDEMRSRYLSLGATELFSKGDLIVKDIAAMIVRIAQSKK
jgi:CheY-like chemotaxis protein